MFSKSGVFSSRLIGFLVVAAFVAPILMAWWMVRTPSLLSDMGLLNRGALVSPPIDIRLSERYGALRDLEIAPGEWAIVYFTDSRCEDNCLETLNLLSTIRILLGHSGTRVQINGLFASGNAEQLGYLNDSDALTSLSTELAVRTEIATVTSGIFFLDWRGQIVSYFPENADPADIKKDIKRLLRASKLD